MIAKPGKDHTIPTSNRPISLLSFLSKLFEKWVLTRINTHLIIQERIPSHQFGFSEGHGAIEQVNRIPTSTRLIKSTFAGDTAILNRSKCPMKATAQLSLHLVDVEKWLSDWRIKVNEQKCKHVTFTLNRQSCPPLTLKNTLLPQVNEVTYLGEQFDRRLTWRRHIEAKRTHLQLKASSRHWLINARSPLSLEYKVLLYNWVLKPIWMYGSQ